MVDYGRVKSSFRPEEIEITNCSVFVASNIEEYEEEIDGYVFSGYIYDYKKYGKDEYITVMTLANAQALSELSDELEATKILLGVD